MKRLLLLGLLSLATLFPISAYSQVTLVGYANSPGTGPGEVTNAINTTGATLLVGVCGSNATGSVTDSAGNTWNSLPSSSNSGYTTIYYAYSHSGGALATSTTHTFTCGLSDGSGGFMAFSGTLTTSAVLDVHSTNTTFSPGSITPTQAGDVVVLGAASNYDYGYGCGAVSGYTSKLVVEDDGSGDNNDMCGWYQIQTTATATSPTAVVTSDSSGTSVIAAFKSNGTGGGTLHSLTDSDTLTLADSLTQSRIRKPTEADTLTLADALGKVVTHFRTMADTATLADSISGHRQASASIADALTTVDAIAIQKKRYESISETSAFSDSISQSGLHTHQVGVAESVTTVATLQQSMIRGVAPSDWLVVSDSTLVVVNTGNHLTEGLTIGDAAAAIKSTQQHLHITLADVMTQADALSGSRIGSGLHSESIGATVALADSVSVGIVRASQGSGKVNPAVWVVM